MLFGYRGIPMPLIAEPYLEQEKVWPQEGRHILAQFDQETVIVYKHTAQLQAISLQNISRSVKISVTHA